MTESLRRHIMMQQAGGGYTWLIGYRFESFYSTSLSIIPDSNHAVLLNVPLISSDRFKVYCGAAIDSYCGFKCQYIKGVAFDEWGAVGNFRDANVNSSFISICVLSSQIENAVIAHLPSNPINAYTVLGKEVSMGNHTYRYYGLSKAIDATSKCIWVPNNNATRITMLLRSAILYYSAAASYIDQWGSTYPNPRTLSVNSGVAYFYSIFNENETVHLYIKNASTQETIWDNGL